MNSIKTLLHRAYFLSSTWNHFHSEIEFLSKLFSINSFPDYLLPKYIKKFLNNIHQPTIPSYNVPRLPLYFSFPYLGTVLTKSFHKEINTLLRNSFPSIDFKIIFTNPLTIGSLFKFKDSVPFLMRSNVIYQYNCPCCSQGSYVGSSQRRLLSRICAHIGVSHRTLQPLSNKEFSSPRQHSTHCKSPLLNKHFKILTTAKDSFSLLILESLFIKMLQPPLNRTSSSTTLLITTYNQLQPQTHSPKFHSNLFFLLFVFYYTVLCLFIFMFHLLCLCYIVLCFY